jgi:hypothetical protein
MTRSTKGGEMQYVGGTTIGKFPVWLELSNPGHLTNVDLVAAASQDGVHWWTSDVPRALPAAAAYYAGPVVTSHDTSVLNTAHFDGLSLIDSAVPADIGATGVTTTTAIDLLQVNRPTTIEAPAQTSGARPTRLDTSGRVWGITMSGSYRAW